MEGGRYFRTGAYEKEKYLIKKDLLLSTSININEKCEKSVMYI